MKAISYWLWIVGSVILGLLIFAAGYKYLSATSEKNAELESIESFEGLVNTVNDLCWEVVGNKRIEKLVVYENVQGIYASNDKSKRYTAEELLQKVEASEISEGEYLCIQIKNKRPMCKELECNASLPFLGYNEKNLGFQAIFNRLTGRGNKAEYNLELEKESDKVVVKVK